MVNFIMAHLTFPDQLSIRLGTEGHDLPIRNRHFDDEVQMLVLLLLVLRLLPLFRLIGDDPHALFPGVTIRNFCLQEVHSRLHLRKQLQLEVSNAEVPPNITGDNTRLKKLLQVQPKALIIVYIPILNIKYIQLK